jgi:hypothetical protein
MHDFHSLLQPAGTGTCPGCGDTVEFFKMFGKLMPECDKCRQQEIADIKFRRRQGDALAAWESITPKEFRKLVDPEKLHPAFVPAYNGEGRDGCGLVGPSGGGKTRIGYRLLRDAAMRGLTPYAVTAAEYRQAAANRHHSDAALRGAAVTLLNSARTAQALLLDDIGKGASTPTGDEALYDLLNERRDNHRLTFWTSNGGAAWLQKRLGPDHGPAIIMRLVHLATAPGADKPTVFNSEP